MKQPAQSKTVLHRIFEGPLLPGALFALSLLIPELGMRLGTSDEGQPFFTMGLFFTAVLTGSGAFLLFGIGRLLPRKVCLWILSVSSVFVTALCMAQLIYYDIFGSYFVLLSARGMGKAVSDFGGVLMEQLWRVLWLLILMVAALVGWIWLLCRHLPAEKARPVTCLYSLGMSVVFYLVFFAGLLCGGREDLSPWTLYWQSFEINPEVRTFGAVNGLRLDIKFQVFGTHAKCLDTDTPTDINTISDTSETRSSAESSQETSETEPTITYNELDLDFDGLKAQTGDKDILQLHEYFSSITPTRQNEYTGMFRGKNIIMITAEAFYPCAVDETLTPTLYKMAHDGLEFTNYYAPGWGGSTLDGEYANLIGLIPKSGVWSLWRARENNLYFTLGNVTSRLGYQTLAYHNHTYNYYSRDESHFNLGYTYKGIGNGLELPTDSWPRSDDEMIKATVSDYITGDTPFSVYYLTVSGHAPYSKGGSAMSARNYEAVANWPLSEEARCYLAAQMELDKAMETLLAELEKAGKLNDTLIVLAADHYPYGLSEETLKEFLGDAYETNFELYHNTLIMYSPQFAHTVVDKPCYSMDVLPTALNLMGADYDSRLLIGSDILSDSRGMAIFLNRSWITAYGRYNGNTGVFTPAEGTTTPEGYVDAVNAVVSKKFSVSRLVLDTDYYASIFGANPHTAS